MPLLSWSGTKELIPELKFKQNILKELDRDNLLLIETPWYWLNQKEIEETAINWLNSSTSNKIVTESLYDPYPCVLSNNIDESRHIRVSTEDIPFWLLYVDRFFNVEDIDSLQPKEFEYTFLCYQRKPSIPREKLYNQLKDLNGLITYGGDKYEEVPNDISTLGDQGVWNKSLLNIISETEYDSSYKVFLSEKTFKPIIGHRPFLIYGDTRINKYLRKLGFRTFEKYFEYNANNHEDQATQLYSIINNINDPQRVYSDLIGDISHNYNHFSFAAKEAYKKIEKLKEVL
jgi:hypothetical protein